MMQRDVARFMREVKELDLPDRPVTKQAPLIRRLCQSLMQEELAELVMAMDEDDLIGIADGLADLLYVTFYTCCSYGIDIEPIFAEVQRSNMTKKGAAKRPDGKQLKGSNYSRPNLKPILEAQSNR